VGHGADDGEDVVHDQFVPASEICAGSFNADCKKFGIH